MSDAEKIPWTAHPLVDELIPPLSDQEARGWLRQPNGEQAVLEYWKRHEAMIKDAQEDPLRHGFDLPAWKEVREQLTRKEELHVLGGNGSSKTELGGKLVTERLVQEGGKRVLCVATNENSSKQLQQPAVYKYLPPMTRQRNERPGPQKREHVTKVKYTPAGGFTEGTFVLPNRSQCWFKTVRQYTDDPNSFEGPEYDFVWIDEPAPLALLITLRYRVAKRNGKILLTFTAVNGFDAVCGETISGAKVVKSLPLNFAWPGSGQEAQHLKVPELKPAQVQVKGCPAGHMPFVMQPLDRAKGVIFLWTHWNVFLPKSDQNPRVPAMFDKCRGKGVTIARTRLFGWTEKISGSPFPQFNANVHVIAADQVPPPGAGTDYMSADPATARSYFLLWVRVDQNGRKYIYDESPRLAEGEWVSADGERGDGQRVHAGKGVNWYKEHIRRRELENGTSALRRKGDPRAFATEAQKEEGAQSLLDLFNEDGKDEYTRGMYFEPAKVRYRVDLDLEKVNDELAYDDEADRCADNEPKLYISDRCQNLIKALLNWTLEQGADSPWKDPVDALRYLFDEPLYYVDPKVPEVVGGRGW